MIFLKADTNVEVLIGPAVAVGDGFTPVTTLSLSTADEAEIIKYGGATALTVTSISANTMSAITGADGYYTLDLTTGNVDTEGFLVVVINDDSLILPLRHEFMVVNANVYDSLFAAAATDYLQVDTFQLAGTTQDATDLADFAAAGYDPATNKVQGVVLVDTTTANTDMRGTDSAALASVATEARLAELDAANLPADVDTLLGRITSTLFTGITSLAEWIGLLAGKQTGNATARTEIRATGAGAGTYDETTDSNEAIRDTAPLGTAMRGTDSAALASVATEARLAELDPANLPADLDAVLADTADMQPKLGTPATSLAADIAAVETDTADIQTRLPAALVGGKMDSDMTAISGDTAAADNLEALGEGVVPAQVNDAAATTTSFIADGFTEATDDHYIGRLITFRTGALAGQQTDITDYVGSTQTFTVTALTEAPADNDFFVIH